MFKLTIAATVLVVALLGQYMCNCEQSDSPLKRLVKRGGGYGGYNSGYGGGYNGYMNNYQIPNIYYNSATGNSITKFNVLLISTVSTALWFAVAKLN
jgi:hypothetical protein